MTIKVYSINEVCDILQITRRTVYTYIKEGKHCPIVNERKYQTMQVLGENVG